MTGVRAMARRGLTLMEVMVSLALLSGIGAVVYTALGTSFIARDALAAEDEIHRAGRAAISRITRELQLAFLTDNHTAINTYRTVFISENADPMDRLWFSSLSHHRVYRNARECDQTEITIWGESDPTERGDYVLLHREAPRVDHEPAKDGTVLPLAYGVKRFDVKFLDTDSGEWVEEWNSVEGGVPGSFGGNTATGAGAANSTTLPRAARVILVLEGPDPEDPEKVREVPFVTTVMLEYAGEMQRSALASGSENAITAPAAGGGRGGRGGTPMGRSLPIGGGL